MKYLFCIFLYFSISASGQYIFTFESDDLNEWQQSPAGHWEISYENALAGSYSLHHFFDNPQPGVDYIYRNLEYPDLMDTLFFSFLVRHAYSPSSMNNWQVFFLASEGSEMEPGIEGSSSILAGVNYDTSDDLLKVWQLWNGQLIEICSSTFNYQERIGTSAIASFGLLRFPNGSWELRHCNDENSKEYALVGSGNEVYPPQGKFAGIRYSYSSAQDRKLWIDDIVIEGKFIRDTLAPEIEELEIGGLNKLLVKFNEPIQQPLVTDYTWDDKHPDSIRLEGNKATLYFSQYFPNRRQQEIHISGMQDQEGNTMNDTIIAFIQNLAEFGDLVISEVMADPEPEVYLPPCEYIEVWNRSHYAQQLKGWRLNINTRDYIMNEKILEPGEFLILTSQKCMDKYPGVECLELLPSNAALPNSGGTIHVFDLHGRLIHFVDYLHASIYGNLNSEGGWSLERTDAENLCGGKENWNISRAWKGGTPGVENSIKEKVTDFEAPVLQSLGMPDSSSISAKFNEPLMISGDSRTEFFFQKQRLYPYLPPGSFVASSVNLNTGEAFSPGRSYEIKITGAEDCAGNESRDISKTIEMPVMPTRGMILITEIMYDAIVGNSEYIEFMNAGEDFIDLYNVKLGYSSSGSPVLSSIFISAVSHLLEPGGRLVLCKNSSTLRTEWGLDWDVDIVEIPEWKTLPNLSSCISLQDRSGKLLDQFCYHDSLHSDLLGFTSGVALERISNLSCPSASSCWTSASSSVNYGTPGRVNSQWLPLREKDEESLLSYRVFSPDHDGHQDILEIFLPAYYATSLIGIRITDLDGFLIRKLVEKGYSGQADRYFWNGEDEQGHIVLPGIYIVHINVSTAGETKTFREACAVSYR